MPFDAQKHHRQSIRLKGYDYAQPGAYFITIVTQQRECLFGDIVNDKMVLSALGKVVDECWQAIPNHFPNTELGAYIVMPNHVHGIIIINELGRGMIYRAPTTNERFGKPVKGSIPTIVRTFKTAATRRIGRDLDVTHIWQRSYYEHIIRNQIEWEHIHAYIQGNPIQWKNDVENPAYEQKS